MPYVISPYVISVVAASVGAAVLLIVLLRLGAATRRLSDTALLSRAHFSNHTGMLAARIAALRVALNERRHRTTGGSAPSRPRSIDLEPDA